MFLSIMHLLAKVLTSSVYNAFRHLQEKIEFWTNVWGFSMAPIREMALREPLVDSVSAELVVTSVANLASININTMTEKDISFLANFELVMRRDDHMHAIALWFDVYFDSSHKKVRSPLSSNPVFVHLLFTSLVSRAEKKAIYMAVIIIIIIIIIIIVDACSASISDCNSSSSSSSVCTPEGPYGSSNGGLPIPMWGCDLCSNGLPPESQLSWLSGRHLIISFWYSGMFGTS
jgi:hypothetical protein